MRGSPSRRDAASETKQACAPSAARRRHPDRRPAGANRSRPMPTAMQAASPQPKSRSRRPAAVRRARPPVGRPWSATAPEQAVAPASERRGRREPQSPALPAPGWRSVPVWPLPAAGARRPGWRKARALQMAASVRQRMATEVPAEWEMRLARSVAKASASKPRSAVSPVPAPASEAVRAVLAATVPGSMKSSAATAVAKAPGPVRRAEAPTARSRPEGAPVPVSAPVSQPESAAPASSSAVAWPSLGGAGSASALRPRQEAAVQAESPASRSSSPPAVSAAPARASR